ncbi:MAG TPA: peptidase M14, partial [Stenotrophomonas sp.]|nr:peptidase M14 [Stenotrophomonas sp.]
MHRVVSRPIAWLLGSLWLLAAPAFAQSAYFFPQGGDFDPSIPTPQQFLGYDIGSRYTRHDQLVAYFEELARHSDKIKVERIGSSYEGRPLLIATVTSAQNQQQLETLRRQHVTLADPAQPLSAAGSSPVVVWLGYSVHGNETSSGEAALLTAYYLVANRSAETAQWLQQAVVLFDPAQNPDGRDRAASWHNAYASSPASADPADKEHVEPFPQGRTNHYFTDLNRDWLALTQQDTRPKIAYFHRWYPNVQIDFHEMGKDSTYYFEPSPASMHSPLLPASSYAFNKTLARYHAQALDALGSLYYTGENFDNFSPVYGSTYPDFHGAVGVTVEQASSRGRVQESVNGLLTFPFTIRNQVATGLGTVRGAVTERDGLLKLQKDFFQSALKQAGQQPIKAFVFGDAHDPGLTARLLDLLLQHQITVEALTTAVTVDGQRFEPGSAYVVPTAQPQFRLVHSIFADTPPIKGDVFYGSTSYAIAPAYGVAFAGSRSRIGGGQRVTAVAPAQAG